MIRTMKPLFSLGKVVATPGALAAMHEAHEEPGTYLQRHVTGDWGECCPEDAQANEDALNRRLRVFSVYKLGDGTKIWIITEADRSSTCVLLPSEY